MDAVRHDESPAGSEVRVGIYMLLEYIDDLPLDTSEKTGINITCVEARDENFYVGTSAHELLHFVLLPPSAPGTPQPSSAKPTPFASAKPTYILASRIQPPVASSAATQSQQPYIKQILVLPEPSKILVLSSTGILSFWSYPELSPAYGGNVKVGGTNFVGADLEDLVTEDNDALAVSGFTAQGASGRKGNYPGLDNSKMVMVMGKKVVKLVKVKEEEPRLTKNVECPSLIYGVRRGPIACVATNTEYSLLHLEIGGIIPLFPIISSNLPPVPPPTENSPPAEEYEDPGESPAPPPRPASKPATSPHQSPPTTSDTDAGNKQDMPPIRRASSSAATRPHPARSTSMQQAQTEVLSAAPTRLSGREGLTVSTKHGRAVSTGSIRPERGRGIGNFGRNSPLGKGGSMGRISGREVSQEMSDIRKNTPSPTLLASRPAKSSPSPSKSPTKQPQLPLPASTSTARSATSSRSTTPNPTPPGSATLSHPKLRSSKPPTPATASSIQQGLKPHIVSPTPNEFLLITGTSPTDPGVGMFVNKDGDPTRGTISISRFPEGIVLDNGCIIAVLPPLEEDSTRVLEFIPLEEKDTIHTPSEIFLEIPASENATLGVGKVRKLQELVVADIGWRLRFERVRYFTARAPSDVEPEEWEVKRNLEELEAATRISRIGGNVVLFNRKRVWRLIPSPLVVRLDSRLPQPITATSTITPMTREGDIRRNQILSVLKEVQGLEPTTESMFHEIAYIKQKCAILLLSEFLRLPREEDKRQFPVELLATENALIESSLDPRVVVSLFVGFEDELREGKNGVWVYGGIREIVDTILSDRQQQQELPADSNKEKDLAWNGRRDILLLLRRYLSAWRQKKGFGSISQADEKEVFWTIDAALMRCLLTLEATRSPSASQHMAGEVDVRTELYKMVDYPSTIEAFDRCVYLLRKFKRLYVLSILYQSKRMSREVLETWKELFESDDEKMMAEFGEGEEKIADYLLGKKDRELVREYGLWLAKRNYKLGIKVFADERARVKWDVDEVLHMLREQAPGALRGFVEHLVVEKKNYAYANELLLIYLNSLINILSSSSEVQTALQSSYEAYRALDIPKPTYRAFLEENALPGSVSGEEDWWNQRLVFLDLLASAWEVGALCDEDKIREKLEPYKDLLVAEMIVLYGRIGNHKMALELLVQDLRDFDGSVQYCFYGGMENSPMSSKSSVSGGRLQLKINPKDQAQRKQQEELFGLLLVQTLKIEDWIIRQQWVEMLLERWGGWLDVAHVLTVIPDSYSVALLSKFLIQALRTLVREKSETVVMRAMRRGENLRVNAELADKCDEIGATVQTS